MKNTFKFKTASLIIILISGMFIISNSASANWMKTENDQQTQNTPYTPHTQHTPNTQDTQDTLNTKSGVSRDWLNSLTDESGNRIIPDDQAIQNYSNEDPESDAFQRKIFNGQGTNNQFGFSVNSAGDVNGDGYDDIVVGAYAFTSNTGKAYLFFGGTNMNTVPDLVLTGVSTGNYLGWSVASAGDLNADGYDDFVFGADGYNSDQGRAYVFFGGALINNTPDLVMTGETTGSRFGTSVRNAGDVNGDGFTDLIIGALGYSSQKGKAYIYYGGINPDTIADITIVGEANLNYFGGSVSSAGDFNGDGYGDFIIGAYGYSGNTGRAYLYYGSASPDTTADMIMTGPSAVSYFGYSVAFAGDVNGDGFSDLIAGAYGYSSLTGSAYIYFGGVSPDNTEDVIFNAEAAGNYFGISAASAGDLNGDGFDDVVIGASRYLSSFGRTYVYFGGALMNNVADMVMTGEAAASYFGVSVASAGDINGDGYPELIVGANGYSSTTGRVYMYDYFMKNDLTYDNALTGAATGDLFGFSVSSAGDVNGDGYSDVIVGAPYNDAAGSSAGRAYIYFGGAIMDNAADVVMTGDSVNSYFGYSVSDAGDVNGDGYGDVIIGAFNRGNFNGRAYVFLGGSAMDNAADIVMTGSGGERLGSSVSGAGDVNGDGFSDVIIGANSYSSAYGRAYLYFGGLTMNNVVDFTLTGQNAGDSFGTDVADAGDVNGDGYGDILVSAPYNDEAATDAGKIYVYFGNVTMNSNNKITMTGEGISNSYFGATLSGAGDVNGDGYDDVIAGAIGPFTNVDKAYIFFGGQAMNSGIDLILNEDVTAFGISVSSAGDVNKDGFGDVMVGASGYSTGWSNAGRSYIYYGGLSMDNIYDLTLTGEAQSDSFGRAGTSAGDVNGDGFNDIIGAARSNDAGGVDAGRAYIYLGSAISSKPILNYVKDVPNDQGGKLNLKWSRSGLDVNGNSVITDYLVQRSYPPSGGSFSWENVAVIQASHESFYTYTDFTPSDSTSNGSGTLYYRITGRTSDINQYYRSGILYGRSIDNIAPLAVSPFNAAGISNNVNLTWEKSTAPDLLNYILYRNIDPVIDPDTEPVFATTSDSAYLDTAPLSGAYYYFIVAQDIHNNKSPVAVAASPEISITLDLTMFIQGFYNSGIDMQVSDTVTVELRNSVSPFAVAGQSKAIVANDGTVQLTFPSAVSGNYYIAIKHRNSIETWSASPMAFSTSSPVNYDLSSSSSQAFGSNEKQIDTSPLRFGIYSGDENQNGIVDLGDVVRVFNAANSFTGGYVPSDMNGDNLTDLADIVITSNNASAFVVKVAP
ncbi:MAG TPA: integrin alpha [Ignavibacteria bacterium]|nr:integrin alpha [Ignavibacteria bacterium]